MKNNLTIRRLRSALLARLCSAAIPALLATVIVPQVHGLELSVLENARFAWDASTRVVHTGGVNWTQQALGFDLHSVISGRDGDVGTLRLQPYLVRIDGHPGTPAIFDDNHDHELQWRFADFNYTGIGHGRFNIRAGHFELPFGIENVMQTNGTLYQTNIGRTLGLKGDWGASVNGTLPQFVYEFAFMSGDGNQLARRADGFSVGRIALPADRSWWAGLSFLNGELDQRMVPANDSSIEAIDVKYYGLDLGVDLSAALTIAGEYIRGARNHEDVSHWFVDLGWSNRSESTFVYTQWRSQKFEAGDDRNVTVGMRYEPSAKWSGSFEVGRRFEPSVDYFYGAQFRFR